MNNGAKQESGFDGFVERQGSTGSDWNAFASADIPGVPAPAAPVDPIRPQANGSDLLDLDPMSFSSVAPLTSSLTSPPSMATSLAPSSFDSANAFAPTPVFSDGAPPLSSTGASSADAPDAFDVSAQAAPKPHSNFAALDEVAGVPPAAPPGAMLAGNPMLGMPGAPMQGAQMPQMPGMSIRE